MICHWVRTGLDHRINELFAYLKLANAQSKMEGHCLPFSYRYGQFVIPWGMDTLTLVDKLSVTIPRRTLRLGEQMPVGVFSVRLPHLGLCCTATARLTGTLRDSTLVSL